MARGCSLLALLAGLILPGLCALAAPPPTQPTPRIETGMHTALIRRVVADVPRRRLVTAGDDKTVRVWQLPRGRLVSTLRLPLGEGHEGQVFGLAVSPDGRTVAAGGWTGWDWDGAASVYLFDADSGELLRRLGGLPDAVGALAWSPDGHHLAVGLQGKAGLRVLRLADGAEVARDAEYLDKLLELDFAADGRLAAVGLDGMVRLYAADFRLLGRKRVPGGAQPVALRFAPDGARVVVGFGDAPAVTVLEARSLAVLAELRLPAEAGVSALQTAAWTADGAWLYAAGEQAPTAQPSSTPAQPAHAPPRLWRWRGDGSGRPEALAAGRLRVAELRALAGADMVWASEDPAFGVVAGDGRPTLVRGADVVDFSAAHDGLEVSADGRTVAFNLAGRRRVFRTDHAAGGEPGAAGGPATLPPLREAAGWRVTDWQGGMAPRINGRLPRLDDYERARSYAIAPDRAAVLLGTEWALRLLDAEARQRWSVKLPAVAWAVNVSGDGRWALAALSDGTLRWYAMADGREALAYFPHANGRDWIAWVPAGYYGSSVEGDNFVGWHVNRGRDATPDFYRAVQFERLLYRPDVVAAALSPPPPAAHRGLISAPGGPGARGSFDIARLPDIAPPRLRLRTLAVERGTAGPPRARLRLEGEQRALAMRDLTVFVNGIPVTPGDERELHGADAARFSRELVVELAGAENEVRAESFNGVSMGVAQAQVDVPDAAPAAAPPGRLLVLAIGANEFPRLPASTWLAYAARDAATFADTLAQRARGLYRETQVRVLADGRDALPERARILEAAAFLRQARAQDTVVLFLASHGLSDRAGNYYFFPRDAAPEDLDALKTGNAPRGVLPWTVFFDALRAAAGRRVLVVDTCQARGIEGRFEPHALMKRSAASRFSLMVASRQDEDSQEYAPGRHGLFTFALLQAMDAATDTDRDGRINLRELFDATVPLVDALRDRKIGAQTPQLVTPAELEGTPLVRAPAP